MGGKGMLKGPARDASGPKFLREGGLCCHLHRFSLQYLNQFPEDLFHSLLSVHGNPAP